MAYLIGSIPFGLILTKLSGNGDIRSIGSGNIGATNVLRTGNKKIALATLLLDGSKGIAAILAHYFVLMPLFLGHEMAMKEFHSSYNYHTEATYILIAAMLGHCFPIWLQFNGGKGVATTLGGFLLAVPWAGFLAAVTWGIVAGFTRYSSLAALSAVAFTPLFTLIYYGPMPAIITILIAVMVIWRHKENIQRLTAGTESKIGAKRKEQDEPAADTE